MPKIEMEIASEYGFGTDVQIAAARLTAASAHTVVLVLSAFEFDAQSAKASTSGWSRTKALVLFRRPAVAQRALDWSKRKVHVRIFTTRA